MTVSLDGISVLLLLPVLGAIYWFLFRRVRSIDRCFCTLLLHQEEGKMVGGGGSIDTAPILSLLPRSVCVHVMPCVHIFVLSCILTPTETCAQL